MSWDSIFSSEDSDFSEVKETVLFIASTLRDGLQESVYLDSKHHVFSLSEGYLGVALFFAYVGKVLDSSYLELVPSIMDRVLQNVSRNFIGWSLFDGISGVGWILGHLHKEFAGSSRLMLQYDSIIERGLTDWQGSFDLVSGLVGLGICELERFPEGNSGHNLEMIVRRLSKFSERTEHGIAWPTYADMLPPEVRVRRPEKYFDVGVAHGTPGIIAFLGQVYHVDIAKPMVEELLNGTLEWLFQHRLRKDLRSQFPYFVTIDGIISPARAAWCYGDPGIATVLLNAAQNMINPDLQTKATEIALKASQRPVELCEVVDAGFCHGAAGLGHLYSRMYNYTGAQSLRDVAKLWYRQALAFRNLETGVGGFSAWQMSDNGEYKWSSNPWLLEGAAGIGLSIMSSISPIEPSWDRMFLLSNYR